MVSPNEWIDNEKKEQDLKERERIEKERADELEKLRLAEIKAATIKFVSDSMELHTFIGYLQEYFDVIRKAGIDTIMIFDDLGNISVNPRLEINQKNYRTITFTLRQDFRSYDISLREYLYIYNREEGFYGDTTVLVPDNSGGFSLEKKYYSGDTSVCRENKFNDVYQWRLEKLSLQFAKQCATWVAFKSEYLFEPSFLGTNEIKSLQKQIEKDKEFIWNRTVGLMIAIVFFFLLRYFIILRRHTVNLEDAQALLQLLLIFFFLCSMGYMITNGIWIFKANRRIKKFKYKLLQNANI